MGKMLLLQEDNIFSQNFYRACNTVIFINHEISNEFKQR